MLTKQAEINMISIAQHTLMVIALTTALVSGGCKVGGPVDNPLSSGLALLEAGLYEEARDTLITATATYTNSATAHCNLGLAYWKLGDNPAAIAALTKAVNFTEEDARPREILAHVLLDTGNAQGAHQLLTAIDTPSETTLTLMARAAYKAGSSDLARSYLGRALELNSDYPPALYNLAFLCRDVYTQPREALAYYKRFRAAAPNNVHAAETPQAFINMAEAPKPAPPTPEPTLVPVPPTPAPRPEPPPVTQHTTPPGPTVTELLTKADKALRQNNTDIALFTLKDAVKKYPDSADALWALIQIYDKHLADSDQVKALGSRFSKRFPNDPRATVKTPTQATPSTKHQTPVTVSPTPLPPQVENDFHAGLAYYANKDWDAAVASYQKALKAEPTSSRSAYNLGLALKAKGDLDRAAKAFALALQLEKDMPKALYMLGLTEMQQNHNSIALSQLNRLIRVQPDFAKAHYLLGRIYRDEGRPDMSVIHFERFLHLNPTGSSADNARRWLEHHQSNP
jgi:tetratricopeptide (TPR) repeat protein